ncbi:MAG: DNA recombination protein RmuC [Motiliproteus sp.]
MPINSESWALLLAALLVGGLMASVIQLLLRRSELRQWLSEKQLWLQQQQQFEHNLESLRQDNLQAQVELSGARERLISMDRVEEELFQREEELQQQQQHNSRLQAELAAADTRLQMDQQQQQEKLQQLDQARENMQLEFRQLAQGIFEDNSQRFGTQQQEKLQHLLQPLRHQISEFRHRVDDVYDKEAKDRRGLHEQIEHLKQLNLKMSQDALNLTNALKSEAKTQGNWGELVLERVLEESGLRPGYEYQVQFSSQTTDGRRFQPDVIIHLPEDKDIVVDAKVSLVAYERYCSADTDVERKSALSEHLNSLRRHIKDLSHKGYEDLPELKTLDFVLLFVPIEGAFMTAIEADTELFSMAFERNILLVSPSTLLVTLRTINNIWRYEKQNQNAQEIARRGGELHDKFVGFVESLEDVGRHLQLAQGVYETAHKRLVSGKGNLVNRVSELKNLGVRGKKKLPKGLQEGAEENDNMALEERSAANNEMDQQSLPGDQ